MEDDELQQIRARRMAELRAQSGGSGSSTGGLPAGLSGGKDDDDEKSKKSQMEEMRRTMLIQILDGEARERLSRIAIVKPDKARAVEDLLIRMAQGGQVRSKITETQLIELLEQVNQQTKSETKIVYNRRRYDDSDDDDYGL
ncbi:PDCD5-related protein [Lobosporangium transversale]|uniref:PDCD5-related protein n=1 Tax=Lobosporangium transversale TaxID=64571 RepID=A0A1Y2GTG8_9FUNG|nr:PDCD5-related protein [Lobosporangium transversale]ORZ22809.1 PDCD5-related protein [Lobosporangium transversale]|eukprot:XP_021883363.1 PDCD5-related protein [Lobosporangium transversale]